MELTNSTVSDQAIVERAQRGDHQAFGELVSRHDRRLRALARRLRGTPDRADDALQDAYLKAFRHLDRFRRDADVATWLYRITYNSCLDELGRRPVEACPATSRTARTVNRVRRSVPSPGPRLRRRSAG